MAIQSFKEYLRESRRPNFKNGPLTNSKIKGAASYRNQSGDYVSIDLSKHYDRPKNFESAVSAMIAEALLNRETYNGVLNRKYVDFLYEGEKYTAFESGRKWVITKESDDQYVNSVDAIRVEVLTSHYEEKLGIKGKW